MDPALGSASSAAANEDGLVAPVEHFQVPVVRAEIEPHTNADTLEVAHFGDYLSVVKKGLYRSGQLVAYIPDGSLIPPALIQPYVERGILPPSALPDDGTPVTKPFRVRPVKLRGVLSQGVIVPAQDGWVEGQDVKSILGVEKWEPPEVPEHMGARAGAGGIAPGTFNAGNLRCVSYDIENIRGYPKVLQEGEEVVVAEKIHGTWCQIAVMCSSLAHEVHGRLIVSSKGLAARGVALQVASDPNVRDTIYVRAARHFKVQERVERYFEADLAAQRSIFVLGEIFGAGVQDLAYGAQSKDDEKLGFRVFDILLGSRGVGGRYLNDAELDAACAGLGLPRVPVLYRGPFSRQVVDEYTIGKETITGKGVHIREGVVIRPVVERRDGKLGRVQLKSISEKYLLRANGTEFH